MKSWTDERAGDAEHKTLYGRPNHTHDPLLSVAQAESSPNLLQTNNRQLQTQRRSLGGPLVCFKNTKKAEQSRENPFGSLLRPQKHAQRGGMPRNTMWQ